MEIPHPCTENYAHMSPASNGRHCAACSQTVVDFTHMSAEEIKNYFQKPGKENTCGRYKSYQVGRATVVEKLLMRARSKVQLIRIRPVQFIILGLISSMLSFSSCFMGKKHTKVTGYTFRPVSDSTHTIPSSQPR